MSQGPRKPTDPPDLNEQLERLRASRDSQLEHTADVREVLARGKRILGELETASQPGGPLAVYKNRGRFHKAIGAAIVAMTELDREMNPP